MSFFLRNLMVEKQSSYCALLITKEDCRLLGFFNASTVSFKNFLFLWLIHKHEVHKWLGICESGFHYWCWQTSTDFFLVNSRAKIRSLLFTWKKTRSLFKRVFTIQPFITSSLLSSNSTNCRLKTKLFLITLQTSVSCKILTWTV